ncbi:DUF2225 domain-containing protein [bacterium]|nr:DUF2225 domain-containing protein [bacterium]
MPIEIPRELFWKTFKDPITGIEFQGLQVKSSAYSIRSRDPDFAPRYDGVNPLWYSVIVSPVGFAAEEQLYKRSPKLLFRDRDELVAQLRGMPPQNQLMGIRDLPMACQAFTLALTQSEFLRVPKYEQAGLALKASWLYRDWAEQGYEPAVKQAEALRQIALQKYELAYEKEDTSKLKIGGPGVGYLIAELLRELGRFDDSLRWFSRIVTDKSATGEVKRMARLQMDTCREQREQALETGTYSKPVAERYKERTMHQLYRDQVGWLKRGIKDSELGESDFLRGLLDGLMKSELDFTQFASEEQVTEWFLKRLKG